MADSRRHVAADCACLGSTAHDLQRAAGGTQLLFRYPPSARRSIRSASCRERRTGLRAHGNEEALSPYYAAERSLDGQLDRLTQLTGAAESRHTSDELVALARTHPSRLLDAIHNVLLELRGRRARILHVEDDESLTALVEELLSDEAEVVRAHSLAQARARVEAERFDLVILDAALGDGTGLDLLPVLHQAGGEAPPVILYSATEPSRDLSERVQAALVKSRDSVEHLLATVRRLAGRARTEATS